MKLIGNKLFFVAVFGFLLTACKKEEAKVFFQGGKAPTLTASVTDSIPLSFANANQTAVTLSWTNPNYMFNTGISSYDVTYLLEIDTMGANFTNPSRESLSISKDLSISLSVSQLNDFLLNQLALKSKVQHHLEFRVTSSLGKNEGSLASNTISLAATPYEIPPKVSPPSSGKLFITGGATAGGWMAGGDKELVSQQFTQVSPTEYKITISLVGGQQYLLVPVYGDWSHKYSVKDNTIAGLWSGGDFGMDLSQNFPGPASSGSYTIDVDFQRGKFTVK